MLSSGARTVKVPGPDTDSVRPRRFAPRLRFGRTYGRGAAAGFAAARRAAGGAGRVHVRAAELLARARPTRQPEQHAVRRPLARRLAAGGFQRHLQRPQPHRRVEAVAREPSSSSRTRLATPGESVGRGSDCAPEGAEGRELGGQPDRDPLSRGITRPGGHDERARLGSARLGSARLGSARLGSARLGSARLGSARLGSARLGSARLGSARLGSARLGSARLGSARLGSARLGSARLGSARLGSARLGSARLGSARLGSARLGSARLGSARLGSARLGSARLGSARLGS